MAPLSPTVARWELVLRLRELREQRGFDSAGFARRVGFTPANWSHVEKGRRVLTTETIGPVLELLEVEAEERAELLTLLEASKQRGWWAKSSALIGPELQRSTAWNTAPRASAATTASWCRACCRPRTTPAR